MTCLRRLSRVSVQKGSGPIWTFDGEHARLTNVQIGPDPFWTLTCFGWFSFSALGSALARLVQSLERMRHVDRDDPLGVLLGRDQFERRGCLDEGRAVVVRLLGDLGGVLVANVRVEGGYEHQ